MHLQRMGRVAHLCIAPFLPRVSHPCVFARVGCGADCATPVRSTLAVVDAVVVPAPSLRLRSGQALRKVREGRAPAAVVASAV